MKARVVWFAAGAAAGVYAMVKGRRAAEALTADGLKDRAQAVGLGMRMFRDEVAQGKVEKEAELRERLAETHRLLGGTTYDMKQIEEGKQ